MKLDFQKQNGLIPAVIQDALSKNILMVGFMNEEAYQKTVETGFVTFFSRTKNRLWTKGEESGNYLKVVAILPDCDMDTVLIKVKPTGPVCHTGNETCFEKDNPAGIEFLKYLQDLIVERKENMPEGSYTTSLFQKGINKIAQKVGEEAVELIIESKDNNDDLFLNEAADLMYHLTVLLVSKGFGYEDVIKILEERHK